MKVKVKENNALSSEEIILEVKEYNDDVKEIVDIIESLGLNIMGKIDNEKYLVPLKNICYFEAVDNRVFAYTTDNVYEINYKIQELVENFYKVGCIQIARTIVLNVDYVDKLKTLVNGRILVELSTGEKLIITRAYSLSFKEYLKKKGSI